MSNASAKPLRQPGYRRRMGTILAGLVLSAASHAELVVIVNPAIKIQSLTRDEVSRIFMIKSKTLPDGSEIVPLGRSTRDPVCEQFYSKITSQTKMQRDAYWARLLFTGKGRPPEDAHSDQEMKSRVAADRKYIGYIDATQLDGSVKVVYRLR